MKKLLIFTVVVSCLSLLTGCGKDKTKNYKYTNKYECTLTERIEKDRYDSKGKGTFKRPVGAEVPPVAVESSNSVIFDFNKEGNKLLSYNIVRKYNYLLDYDMEEEKAYYIKECDKIDKKMYKSCDVALKDKTITITMKVDIDSEENKEKVKNITLDGVKKGFSQNVGYTCK